MGLLSTIGGALSGVAQGSIFGNPISALGSGIMGALGQSGASTAGGASNSYQNLINGGYLGATEALEAQQMTFQLQLQAQSQQFDEVTSERSEILRESNTLRSVAMEQRKADNGIVNSVTVLRDAGSSS
ncbi:MAG: hypothetical protein ABSD03_09330 [Vulcanimicrobiaceae bacterium]|jgi:hypothetical protein